MIPCYFLSDWTAFSHSLINSLCLVNFPLFYSKSDEFSESILLYLILFGELTLNGEKCVEFYYY